MPIGGPSPTPIDSPEDIVTFAADYLPYQLPAMASLAHDLLDG
jgi:hypothetical protein